jgi:hypothetical protein
LSTNQRAMLSPLTVQFLGEWSQKTSPKNTHKKRNQNQTLPDSSACT